MTTGVTSPAPLTTTPVSDHVPGRRFGLLRAGVTSGTVAAIITTAMVVAARAAGVRVDIQHQPIPLGGFPQLTIVAAILGATIARMLATRAARPRHTFNRTAATLTAISLVPAAALPTETGSKLVLICTHLVAAAIIIPRLSGHLPATAKQALENNNVPASLA